MNKLRNLVLAMGLAVSPVCGNAQNTPSSPPLHDGPESTGNELPESGGVGTGVGNPTGWHRYLPETPTGWGALLVGTSAVASFAWRRYNEER